MSGSKEPPDMLLVFLGLSLLWLIGRPLVKYAAGVFVGARTVAGNAIEAAGAAVFREHGIEAVVTSAREGEHMPGSAHYTGNARDFRTLDVPTLAEKYAIADEIGARLGPAFDVVLEFDPEHIHAELDPTRGADWSGSYV